MLLNVSNIQHFSTGDGPGIRTTVFLKGCNLHCPWCHNPETISPKPQELFYEKAQKRVRYGRMMTVEEIYSEVMEDIDFYTASGGGVTFSGGEPLLQSDGIQEVGKMLKDSGVSVIIDTAGNMPAEVFSKVMDVTDIFFFDYKTGSHSLYKNMIGGDLNRIYDNLCFLISSGAGVRVRIPIIPEVNTSDEDCFRIVSQLKAANVKNVDLIPFHRLGSGKYEALGMKYDYKSVLPMKKERIERIAQHYRECFEVYIEN